jgi:hypothetical protein
MDNQVYDVGHILFLLFERKRQVVPVQVSEQITRKTLSGEKIEYIVTLPNEKRATTELSSLGSQTFQNIEDAQAHMLESAKLAIDAMVLKTTQLATDAFGVNIKYKNTSGNIVQSQFVSDNDNDIDNIITNETTKIDLGNGVIGNLKNG